MAFGPPFRPAIAVAHAASLAGAASIAEPRRVALALCIMPALILLSETDLRRAEIPDGAVAVIALAGAGVRWHELGLGLPLATEFAAAAMVTALLWLLGGAYFRRTGHEALGIGDAKLIGAGSLAVGAASLWALVLVASMGGIVAGLLARRRGALPGLPFGPFLAYSILLFTLFPLAAPALR